MKKVAITFLGLGDIIIDREKQRLYSDMWPRITISGHHLCKL